MTGGEEGGAGDERRAGVWRAEGRGGDGGAHEGAAHRLLPSTTTSLAGVPTLPPNPSSKPFLPTLPHNLSS
eukprot:3276578-Prymnesium_polylepis.1